MGVHLTDEPDKLVRWWTNNCQYSSKTCYYALFQGSLVSGSWKLNWRSWAPPRVRFFIWLACQDRCWTGERLARRQLPHRPRCVFCDQSEETMSHILTGCPFSRIIWHEVLSWIRSTAGPPVAEGDFAEWWTLVVRSNPCHMRKGTSSLIMLTAWWVWKHRNAIVFNNELPSVVSLVDTIKAEARSWANAGARGLRQLLP
jgi:hypothetical protein